MTHPTQSRNRKLLHPRARELVESIYRTFSVLEADEDRCLKAISGDSDAPMNWESPNEKLRAIYKSQAFMLDALSLLTGVASGNLKFGEPRIASSLIEGANLLSDHDLFDAAGMVHSVIRDVSDTGLTVERPLETVSISHSSRIR